jgi:predicted P-loop ATPase
MKKKDTKKKAEKKKSPSNEEPVKYSFIKMELFLKDWYTFKYNEVTNEIEYKNNRAGEWKIFDEMELNSLYVGYRKENIKFSKQDLISLLYSSFTPRYNPFIDYFDGLNKWDGQDYIKQLCDYVKVVGKPTEQERFYVQLKKMLLRTLACAIDENLFNKQIFVLYGAAQNQYKSSFIRNLVPHDLRKYYSENFNSDRDKDSAISICENFIINIDELAGLARFELNKLKSTLSRLSEKVRLPFAKRATLIPRRASFFGSTNEKEFLTDVTGNVRWICFHIESISPDYLKLDINKLWSQIYALYNDESEMAITISEIKQNEEANTRHQIMTSEMELINKYFSQGSKESDFFTATDIVDHLSKLVSNSIRLNPVSIGKAMRYLSFVGDVKENAEKKYPEKGYYINCECGNCKQKKELAGALSSSN